MSFNRNLGFRLDAEADAIVLDPQAEHEVVPGTLHFAVLATLGEVAAAHAAAASVVPTHVSLQLLKRATETAPFTSTFEEGRSWLHVAVHTVLPT